MSKRTSAMIAFLSIALLALTGVGCGSDDGDDCSTATMSTQMMGATLVAACLNCHSSTKMGNDRNGAPTTANFDTDTDRVGAADGINTRVMNGSMPPSGALTADQQEAVRLYLSCLADSQN